MPIKSLKSVNISGKGLKSWVNNGELIFQGDPKKAQIRIQIDQLRKQITDSESNLAAQREAIPVMKEVLLFSIFGNNNKDKL